MNEVIGDILPLAVAAGLSPIPLIAAVLIVMSVRPRLSGSAFAAGWIIGCGVVVLIGAFAAGLLSGAGAGSTPAIFGWLRIVLGVVLLFLAVRKAITTRGADAELPAWMSGLMSAGPVRSVGLGLLLSAANPKNALLGIAAGISIGAAGVAADVALTSGVVYVLVASVAVLAIVLAAALAPHRTAKVLTRLRDWLTQHNAAIMAVLLLVFGFVLIGKGIEGL
ncbi:MULTISPECIES: GAP family protein [unclassified Microbacterium]|uniref:GAP family protein n=1 Tax=unclassified Microbacterium TaxID=2609290 RepID=UPI000C2C1BBA|nr:MULTISPECIES: GAP family protein [unclassified Microbacterium]